jgi:hypothetical protein
MTELHFRRHQLTRNSIELFFRDRQQIFFTFFRETARDEFSKKLVSNTCLDVSLCLGAVSSLILAFELTCFVSLSFSPLFLLLHFRQACVCLSCVWSTCATQPRH